MAAPSVQVLGEDNSVNIITFPASGSVGSIVSVIPVIIYPFFQREMMSNYVRLLVSKHTISSPIDVVMFSRKDLNKCIH